MGAEDAFARRVGRRRGCLHGCHEERLIDKRNDVLDAEAAVVRSNVVVSVYTSRSFHQRTTF